MEQDGKVPLRQCAQILLSVRQVVFALVECLRRNPTERPSRGPRPAVEHRAVAEARGQGVERSSEERADYAKFVADYRGNLVGIETEFDPLTAVEGVRGRVVVDGAENDPVTYVDQNIADVASVLERGPPIGSWTAPGALGIRLEKPVELRCRQYYPRSDLGRTHSVPYEAAHFT